MPLLTGKVAIVTGAASGFGEAIAKAFAREGATVIIADIAVAGGNRVVEEITTTAVTGGRAVFLPFDVTSLQAWQDMLVLAQRDFGGLDIVVNNAGTTYAKKPSVEVSEGEFAEILAVNVTSVYLSVVAVMPYFVGRGRGVFLNTSSVAGTRVRPGQVFYGGTKGFVNTVTQGLAAEYGPAGVRVNSICPLRGATGLLQKFSGVEDTPEERERFAKTVPLGRMSEPADIGAAAVFLVSDQASFITGVNLPVDGGRLAV